MFPEAADNLGFGRYGTEAFPQFEESVGEILIGNRLLVVKPPGQEDFVPPI